MFSRKKRHPLPEIILVLLFIFFTDVQQNVYAIEQVIIPPRQNNYHYTIKNDQDGLRFVLKDRICSSYRTEIILTIERDIISFESSAKYLTILPSGKDKWKVVVMTEQGPVDAHDIVKKAREIQKEKGALAHKIEELINSAKKGHDYTFFASDIHNMRYPIIRYYTCYTLSEIKRLKQKWRDTAAAFLKAVSLKKQEIQAIMSKK